MNVAGAERCGNCGASIASEGPKPEDTARFSDPGMPKVTAPDNLFTPSSVRHEVGVPSGTDPMGKSLHSMAVNIRRIFLVLLTILAIWALNMSMSLYVSVSDDPNYGLVVLIAVACVFVAGAGILYAISSKRLST